MATLVIVGISGKLSTSPDGTNWTSRTSGFGTNTVQSVAWSPSLNLFVVGGQTAMSTSPDGITWTLRTSVFDIAFEKPTTIVWSSALSLFVAGSDSGRLATSPNGITWTLRTSPFGASPINAVAWSPSLNLFVAVGNTVKLATSPDGINWTLRTATGQNSTIMAVAWSPGLNLFAIGGAGSPGPISTSPDGINWTARISGFTASNYPTALAWSPSLSLFVAAGSNGMSTSPDGITWTARSSGLGVLNAVCWSPSLNLFVAVGSAGGLTTSPNGTTWTVRTSGFGTNVIYGITSGLDNTAPNAAITNTPANNAIIDRAVTNRFGWTFSDPDVGDSQSKFDLQYRLGAGAWVPITGTTPNSFWDAAPATFAAGSYEWQVRTYDSQGLVGPWSASSFFTAASAPATPTIAAPINGSTVVTTATLTWSAPTQTNYQVRRVADLAGAADAGTVYYDSGDVVDGTTRSVTVAFPINNRWEHVQVRVKAAGLWSTWASVRVNVTFTAPMVPTLTAAATSATASIAVAIVNPAPTGGEPVVSYNDVFVSSPLDPEYRAATLVPPNSTWTWRTPAAGRVYTVRVVAVGSNGTTRTSL